MHLHLVATAAVLAVLSVGSLAAGGAQAASTDSHATVSHARVNHIAVRRGSDITSFSSSAVAPAPAALNVGINHPPKR